jgi:hypothetical protein
MLVPWTGRSLNIAASAIANFRFGSGCRRRELPRGDGFGRGHLGHLRYSKKTGHPGQMLTNFRQESAQNEESYARDHFDPKNSW